MVTVTGLGIGGLRPSPEEYAAELAFELHLLRGECSDVARELINKEEPDDHALGRSRGGWSTKQAVEITPVSKPLTVRVPATEKGAAR